MPYMLIENEGEIERAGLFLLGASSKRGDATKIGFFGSGNKYAMATLLRRGIAFKLFSGEREVAVTTERSELRGQSFDVITLDGERTSFTTMMGPSWEVWFALREFVCNARDEGGERVDECGDGDIAGIAGTTRVFVDMADDDVRAFFYGMDAYMLTDEVEALDTVGDVRVLAKPGVGPLSVYRKGILVRDHDEVVSAFDFDFDKIAINESRIVESDWAMKTAIKDALAQTSSDDVAAAVVRQVTSKDDCFEKDLYWATASFSHAWINALKGPKLYPEGIIRLLPAGDTLDGIVLPDDIYNRLHDRYEDELNWFTRASDYVDVERADAEDAYATLDEAAAELAALGFTAPKDVELRVVEFTSDTTMATAERGTHIVRVALKHAVDADALELRATLAEELMHFEGFEDGTRRMEQELFRRLVRSRREAHGATSFVALIKNAVAMATKGGL